jgi:hypothetical protein
VPFLQRLHLSRIVSRTWPPLSAILCALLGLAAHGAHVQDGKPVKLTAADRKYLDGLFQDFLFDPTGATRMEVKVSRRSLRGDHYEERRIGWHVAEKSCVFFTDGYSIPAPPATAMSPVDFVAACKARLAAIVSDDEDTYDANAESDLVLAAWLHRLGHEDLATRMLAVTRKLYKRPDAAIAKRVRFHLAEHVYQDVAFSFVGYAGADALVQAQRFLKLYAFIAADYPGEICESDVKRIVAELRRRKANGTFGKRPDRELPTQFNQWDRDRKVEYLVGALEHVRTHPLDIREDPRVAALISLGEGIVPRLIDTVEKDSRLTHRLIIHGPDSEPGLSFTLLGVRDLALEVIQGILRTGMIDPNSRHVYVLPHGIANPFETGALLRRYVKKYGELPFDERMMTILTDKLASAAAWRDAAVNLVFLHGRPEYAYFYLPMRARPKAAHLALDRISNPTTAEAILAALDRETTAFLAAKQSETHSLPGSERYYLYLLAALNDKRITPVLAGRSRSAKSTTSRMHYAEAAHWLGDSQPLHEFAEDCRVGKRRGDNDLKDIVATLAAVRDAQADRALNAFADPTHPWYRETRSGVLGAYDPAGRWLVHPFCLPILRRALDDRTPTGTNYEIRGKRLLYGNGGSEPIPDELHGVQLRTEAVERLCDVAAAKLGGAVVGLPTYHCLFEDADEKRHAMRELLDRFAGRFRCASAIEAIVLYRAAAVVPIFQTLDRPATAEDVKAGHAVFDLDGKGKRVDRQLPLVGEMKAAWNGAAERVLIVQAEQNADGEVIYGVIGRHSIRAVPDRELARVLPLDAEQWQTVRE